jgi:hypothetical protein
MKFRCDRKAFLEVVGLLGGVTAGRGTRPILQHILIKANGSDLELLATDLEVALRCRHRPIVLEEPGAICPPAMLASILREARTIDVSTDGNVILPLGAAVPPERRTPPTSPVAVARDGSSTSRRRSSASWPSDRVRRQPRAALRHRRHPDRVGSSCG